MVRRDSTFRIRHSTFAAGVVTDREPNLVHMQARHYDPTIGRFLQADSLMLASFTTQGTNRYLYTENDPVNRSDPTGQFWWALVGMVVLGGILGGILNMVTAGASAEHFASGFLGGAVSAGLVFLLLPFGFGPAALGGMVGSVLTSALDGDPESIRIMKGGSACVLYFLLLRGEKALPWGFAVSMLVWFLWNLAWDFFTGGSVTLLQLPDDESIGRERLCSTLQNDWGDRDRLSHIARRIARIAPGSWRPTSRAVATVGLRLA